MRYANSSLILAISALCISQTAHAQQTAPLAMPQPIPLIEYSARAQEEADIPFVTGGIGADETAEIEAARDQYNLYITNASVNGAYVEGAEITIRRAKEETDLLRVEAGPLLYVKLAPGHYVVESRHGEQARKQNVTISAKRPTARLHLGWKVDANTAN